ncbi:MAG: hypothetical protein COU08_00975 [Candidatus Harrisonbacteria bacterium CG10_big_fil_rev_8_21_14_0_10_42_17]|uniref:Dipeptidylpeptidase IV N-terminal domain-containing protein n=1 Tax=Candidatus Harrisonbacteria bacterium CG10_big_fil_rev_8_21_14_0_10_42_17 TaxID=1974584 RepID=A0A2M6WIU2_9BACT|nr:MAG: hypothetical protein COU08_00975 [Candidatus Harrisonbacteria bacterium CG10_big_fil_rev_8_21_14_0_10_42_17]
MRKFLRTTILIILAFGLVFFIWFFFFRNRGDEQVVNPPEVTATPLIPDVIDVVGAANFLVFPHRIADYWIHETTGSIYVLDPNGTLSRVSTREGQTNELYSLALTDVNRIIPSPDQTGALFVYNYPRSTTLSYLDVTTGVRTPLPQRATSADWNPRGDKIAFLDSEGGSSILRILGIEDQSIQDALTLHQYGLDVSWVTSNTLYFTEKPTSFLPSSLWSYNLSDNTFKTLARNEPGLMIQWSDDGRQGIRYTTAEGVNGLRLIDSENNVLGSFQVATLPSKCTIKGSVFYCAVPKTIPSDIVLPDDYFKRKVYFKDSFFIWDSASQAPARVVTPEFLVDAEHLEVYRNELYFFNRYDDKLYKIPLS